MISNTEFGHNRQGKRGFNPSNSIVSPGRSRILSPVMVTPQVGQTNSAAFSRSIVAATGFVIGSMAIL